MSAAASPAVACEAAATARLRQLLTEMTGETVSLGEIADRLGASGIGFVVLILGAITFVPGIAPVFGVALCATAAGLVLGRSAVQIPGFLRRRPIDRMRLERGLQAVLPRMAAIERWLPAASGGRALTPLLLRVTGLAVLVNAVLIVLPVPFGNTAPAVATIVLALGLTAGNPRATAFGIAATVLALAFDILLLALAWEAVTGFLTLV